MSSGSLVVLKDIRRNNLYYLKDNAVTKNLTESEYLKDDSIKLWQMRLRHLVEIFLQALTKQRLVECASTCNLELGGYYVLDKTTKVEIRHHNSPLGRSSYYVHVSIWSPILP